MHPQLFSSETSLKTVTKKYDYHPKDSNSNHFGILQSNNYSFSIDDSNSIYNVQNLTCRPLTFGYSIEQGERVFPPKSYPKCSEIIEGEMPLMSIDYSTNKLYMSCKSGSPYYILEPTKHKGRLYQYSEISPLFHIEKYKKPVDLSSQEFALGSCDGSNFNNLVYVPRFNKTANSQAQQRASVLGQKGKPLIVMLLTVDSYSRRHFFRKLKKTVKFLNKIDDDFSVFDFKLHNIYGDNSIENMLPVLSDIPFKSNPIAREYDTLGNNSMYKIFRRQGFVTLFGLEDCDFYFPNAMGRYPEVDHVVRSLYCAGKEYMNLNTLKNSGSQQRCMGPEMSHWHILNYTETFSYMYQNVSQWIYLHINTAHEATGQHAVTLDDDLEAFLKRYLENLKKTHEIAIFLQADHGMRYGNWFQEIEAYQENKLPAFFLLATKSLTEKIPNAEEILFNNTLRLTTKADLRPTINFLASFPYKDAKDYSKLTKREGKFVNLFQESANLNRTCDDLKLSPFICSCLVIEEFFNHESKPELSHLVHMLIREGISYINSQVRTVTHGEYDECQQISLKKVLNTYGLNINNKIEELQVKFSINELPSAVFEVFAFVGSDTRNFVLKIDGARGTISPFVYNQYKARIRLVGVKRKDKYAGKCEDRTRAFGLKSEFCICKDEKLLNISNSL
jgi:hypothetical protein